MHSWLSNRRLLHITHHYFFSMRYLRWLVVLVATGIMIVLAYVRLLAQDGGPHRSPQEVLDLDSSEAAALQVTDTATAVSPDATAATDAATDGITADAVPEAPDAEADAKIAAAAAHHCANGGPGECALQWLLQHRKVPANKSQVLLAYGYARNVVALAHGIQPLGTLLVALLPGQMPPAADTWPRNVIFWSAVSEHKIRAFATSMNLLDVQLVVQPEALQAAVPAMTWHALLAHIFAMARTTFLLVSSAASGGVATSATDYVRQQQWRVGPRDFALKVTELHTFDGAAPQSLLQVDLVHMVRGVRHFWCFHNWVYKHKFDLRVSDGRNVNLRYIRGGKMKNLTAIWMSNVNMAELSGWGLSLMQRQMLFWDALQVPQFSDSIIQNWVLCCGAHMRRIDINSNRRMHGRSEYLGDLRQMLCLNNLDPRREFPGCGACQTCLGFSFHGKRKPPAACTECYQCVRAQVRSVPYEAMLSGAVENCDTSFVNSTYRSEYRPMYRPSVAQGEDRCYPY